MNSDERMLIAVALYEYISHRMQPDVNGYVNKRYPADQGYSERFRADKRVSVASNIETAERLRCEIVKSD